MERWTSNLAPKQCKVKLVISENYIDEVEVDLIPLDVCGALFGSPYMYMRDASFARRENQYHLIKDGKSFIIVVHNGKSKISLVCANQAKKLTSTSKKIVLFLLR